MATLPNDMRQRSQIAKETSSKAQQIVNEVVERQRVYKMDYERLDLRIQVLQDEVQRIKIERGIK